MPAVHPPLPAQHRAASQLDATLAAFFSVRLKRAARVCVALSGGRDSVALLHALNRWLSTWPEPCSLSAVHVQHGISPHAEDWANFCAAFCRQCGVPLEIVRVEVPRHSGEGLEAAARRMRHGVFAACPADWLVLAHHRDDQAETVLLNLLRGAGIAGAAGMLAERAQIGGPNLVRPLLAVPRSLIERYAEDEGLRWIDDESNADVHYRRNFLRREIVPRLDEKFPGAQRALARAAGHFAEGALLLDELAALDHEALKTPSGRLALQGFNALSAARARNLLRFAWLAAGFRAPDTRWIDEALRQLATVDELSETSLSTADGTLHVFRGELHIVGLLASPEDCVPWSGQSELAWAGGRLRFLPVSGSGIRRTVLVGSERLIKPRQGGERLQPDARRPRRSLRNLLREAAIPPWERQRLPLLWCNGQLLWVGGIGVDAKFACAPGEEGILPVWEDRSFVRH